MNKYTTFVSTMQKIADVEHSIAVLGWDKEVNTPTGSMETRARQAATLSGIAHELFTDDQLGILLADLQNDTTPLSATQLKNVKVTAKRYHKTKKLSKEFVERRSKATSVAYDAWIKARAVNDFSLYRGALKDIFEIKREEAKLLGWKEHAYDALLDEYEPDYTASQLDVLFADVKKELVAFAAEVRAKQQVDDSFIYKFYPKDKQWEYGLKLLKNMGYDFNTGRQDISTHPFTTSFGSNDVRITTRIDEHNFGSMIWSCIHEGGHALYEQGFLSDEYGLPMAKAISLGVHESQSRLWENNVGRSLPYWKAHYSNLQKIFPGNLKSVDLNSFYKGINKIEPSLIRTDSDEIHYHFHVLIRYEIEKALLEGSIEVDNLDQVWNAKYKEYLGIDVPDDNRGVLQDIHWAFGLIGYFPTYSLGSFYAAQFFEQAKKDVPELVDEIEAGKNSKLLQWLREKIHIHGQFYSADELCREVTGESLNLQYFMNYVRKKYADIYS